MYCACGRASFVSQCQGYRNASGLDGRHLATAKRILGRFRFLGLQEAYNASVLLLAHEFKVDLDPADFDMVLSRTPLFRRIAGALLPPPLPPSLSL